MKQTTQFEKILQTYYPKSTLHQIRPLTGGLSADMVVLEFIDETGQTRAVVVRQHTHGYAPTAQNEFRLLQQLHQAQQQTPKPYHLDLSGQILPNPYLIIEFIEGEMLLAPHDLEQYIAQLANQLASIHSTPIDLSALTFLPVKTTSCIELEREKPQRHDSLQESAIRQQLEALTPLVQTNKNVLSHGDFWPGNSLWQNGKLVAVIDWEDACLGDPLRDLAISRCDIVWIFGIAAMHQFTALYQAQMPIDYENLAYWDLCAALRFIRLAGDNLDEWVGFFPAFGRADITVDTLRHDYDYFVAQALENI